MRTLMTGLALLIVAISYGQQKIDTTEQIIAGRKNAAAQQSKPYVILISVDGLRNDMAESYGAKNILRLSGQGVKAKFMQPSYPSLTFPNHYTIVTGLYPSHHGLVNNTFFDPAKNQMYSMGNKARVGDSSWYGGTPLWSLSEQQEMLSASFYWVGSEANIQGKRPTYYYNYNEKIKMDDRITAVKKWLQLPEDKRPHLITFYFPEVDHDLHEFGVGSAEAKHAVQFVDESIGKLVAEVDKLGLPVNFIVVSDHGMTNVDKDKVIKMPKAIDTTQFFVPYGSTSLHMYGKDVSKKTIKKTYKALKKEAQNYTPYMLCKTPKKWHLRNKDDKYNRAGDIVLVPNPPYYFNIGTRPSTNIGYHGFDNRLTDMRASFFAWGPAFKNNIEIEGFENVNVYPLVAEILGLTYDFKIDGKLKVLKPILK